uniref:Uncharacterized protein n=1 Tax=candidate division CPR3 bacterium TaxID=2268181 RepID=A0A7C4M3A1_UNCC3
MKKFLIIVSLIFLIIGLFYFLNKNTDGYWVCKNGKWVKQGKPSYPKPIVSCDKKPALPKNKEECLSEGGIWKKQGAAPFETCNQKTIDRGNLCRDNSECEGFCQIQLTKEELRQTMSGKKTINKKYGQCSVWVVELGCFGVMEKGKAKVICVD